MTVGLEVVDRFISSRRPVVEQQERTLRRMLRKAQYTAFGKHYGFEEMLQQPDCMTAFRTKVPLHDYNKIFSEWWHETLDGKRDIAWPGCTRYFALSSGTSEASTKYIPVTRAQLRALNRSAVRMFATLPQFTDRQSYLKGWLAIGGTSQLQKDGNRYLGYLSGINADRQPTWVKGFYKPGKRIAEITDFDERLSAIAELAPDWDIGVIIGVPHWVQLTLEQIIERHGLDNILDIWPNLTLFICGGASYEPYRATLDRLVGRPLAYLNTYLASEGMMAFQTSPNMKGMEMLLNNGIFFEFIPFDDDHFDSEGEIKPGAQTLTISDVQLGVDYALAISTVAGAWRYLLGDTIRFLDAERAEIVISGRTKFYINLCTEHLTVDNMNAGITATEDLLHITIPEYTVSGIEKDGRYYHVWYIGTDDPVDTAELERTLDEQLGLVNDDYQAERKTALRIEVHTVPVKTFYEWQREMGKANGQSKVPRVMRGTAWKQWLSFVGA